MTAYAPAARYAVGCPCVCAAHSTASCITSCGSQPTSSPKGAERAAASGPSFAGALGRVQRAHDVVAEADQARAGRVPASVQPLLAGQPAVVLAALVGAPVRLWVAAQRRYARWRSVGGCQAPVSRRTWARIETVEREEGELGEVGDGATPAVPEGEVDQPLRAVGLPDPLQGEPVDRRPEGVPDGRAQQGPTYPATEVLLLRTAPDGTGCRTHPDLPRHRPYVRQLSTVIDRERSVQGPDRNTECGRVNPPGQVAKAP